MKFFRILGRSIRDAFRSIFRNLSLSVASLTSVMITLMLVGSALLVTLNIKSATSELKGDLSIMVFISNDCDEFDKTSIETQLKAIENVSSVSYKTKAEIKEEMMESQETFRNIMEDWDDEENPLQNVFVVKVDNADLINETASKIKEISNVTLVKYGEGLVDTLLVAFDGIEKFAYVAVLALFLITVFLIMNTIKLTIYSRKISIGIMRLVGASNFSIKTPFIVEGMTIGILGSIVPIVTIVFGYKWIYGVMNGKLLTEIIDLVKPNQILLQVSLILVGIGALVGMIGSAFAVRRYLKV